MTWRAVFQLIAGWALILIGAAAVWAVGITVGGLR